MPEPLTAEDIQAAARLAGVRVTEREGQDIARVLGGLLGAVRALPAGQRVEPAATFAPPGDGDGR